MRRGPRRAERLVLSIQRDIVRAGALTRTHKKRLGHIGADEWDRAGFVKDLNEDAVDIGHAPNPAGISWGQRS